MKYKAEELFIVVDKKDKIVGYRTRYECHHNKQLIHRAVGVVIFNKKGQILLQKRSQFKDLNPGLYDISASGHVDKGETYLKSAKRELYEELGVKLPLHRKKRFISELPQETEMDCLYTCQYDGPFYPNAQEVELVKFVNINEIPNMISKLTPFAMLSLKQVSIL